MDLFEHARQQQNDREAPLAHRMRPRSFEEFSGQEHIVGEGKMLRRMVEADRLTSIILWGPPGVGKTALANVIAESTASHFERLNAVLAGVKDLREIISATQERRALYGTRTVLFIDEIHRWNKAQQDALLPYVEEGTVILIGATTENPTFEIIRPLLSRSTVFEFQPLTAADLKQILLRALHDSKRGLGTYQAEIDEDALDYLVRIAGGDARSALNALELAVTTTQPADNGTVHVTIEVAQESIQQRLVRYDKGGDEHYDTISAYIKSVRGSDPDAAMFWLGKMIEAGEDPRFIMRRILILAGEDIGMADPNGVVVASACAYALDWMGLPEGMYPLTLATLYLATAPKSNSATQLYGVIDAIKQGASTEVPSHLRSSPRDRSQDDPRYAYPHDFAEHYTPQQYLPDGIKQTFYQPVMLGYEAKAAEWLRKLRENSGDDA